MLLTKCFFTEIEELKVNYIGVPPYDAPEFLIMRELLQEFDKEWGALQNAITGSATSKPISVDIKEMATSDIVDVTVKKIESKKIKFEFQET